MKKKAILFTYIKNGLPAFVIENLEYPKIDDNELKNYCNMFFSRIYENVNVGIQELGSGATQIFVSHSEGYSILTWTWITSFSK